MSFGTALRSGVFVGAASVATLASWPRTSVNDFRATMPAGSTYTRTGAATGLTAAGVIQSFAADDPQRTDRGLALEPARTNLALRSQEFDNAAWSLTRASIVADATTAPDGTTTADKLVEDASASTSHLLLSSANITIVTATAYSTVIMAKASERSWIQLQEGTGVTASAYFNLSGSGAVGTVAGTGSPSASILALTDGWFLCSLLWTSVSTAARIRAYLASGNGGVNYTGDGTSGAFLWQAGLQAGGFYTSPIFTTSAAATRGLPTFTEPVPVGRTKALLTYADATTTLVEGLTPGGTFDVTTAVIGAGKGRFGASELVTRLWYP